MGAVTNTSILLSFISFVASLRERTPSEANSLLDSPKLNWELENTSFIFTWVSYKSSSLSIFFNGGVAIWKCCFCFSIKLVDAYIIKLHSWNRLKLDSDFKIISIPIPFGSPIVIPTFILLDFTTL